MIILNLTAIKEAAKNRPKGYLEDVLAQAESFDDTSVKFTEENYYKLRDKYKVYRPTVGYAPEPNETETERATRINQISHNPPNTPEHLSRPFPTELPTGQALVKNFFEAFDNWRKAGFPVVNEQIFQERMEICKACPFWDGAARAGLGKCNQPSCGCTKIKFWLATEKCPIDKWKAIK